MQTKELNMNKKFQGTTATELLSEQHTLTPLHNSNDLKEFMPIFEQGLSLKNEGKYSEAIEKFKKILDDYNNDSNTLNLESHFELLYNIAICYIHSSLDNDEPIKYLINSRAFSDNAIKIGLQFQNQSTQSELKGKITHNIREIITNLVILYKNNDEEIEKLHKKKAELNKEIADFNKKIEEGHKKVFDNINKVDEIIKTMREENFNDKKQGIEMQQKDQIQIIHQESEEILNETQLLCLSLSNTLMTLYLLPPLSNLPQLEISLSILREYLDKLKRDNNELFNSIEW